MSVVAALGAELGSLRRRLRGVRVTRLRKLRAITGFLGESEIVMMATGAGAALSGAGLTALLDAFEVRAVIVVGIAGALSPDLEVGSLLVAGRIINGSGPVPGPDPAWLARARMHRGATEGTVLSHESIAVDPLAKDRLWRQSGCLPFMVVDMESAAFARSATGRGMPYLVARVVSDGHDETLPLDFNLFKRADGGIDRGRIARHALVNPSILPELVQLRERVQDCAESLADLVEGVVTG